MVKILADSTCDLSLSLISRYKLDIIPLYVHLGDNEYKDGVNIKPSDLYKWSDEHNETPRTSAPGIDDIEAFLDKDSTHVQQLQQLHSCSGRYGNNRQSSRY